MKPIIEVTVAPDELSPWRTLESFEQQHLQDTRLIGACSVFTGRMREQNDGAKVTSMHLEHYPGMTENVIRKHISATLETYPVDACLVKHRIGDISPGETLVLCACWSAHRHQSFRACEDIFEALKSSAPFWKNETLESGETRWVTNNTKNPRDS